jgi:predicted dehydrogenase
VNGRIRIGVIGLGRVTQLHHLPNLAGSTRAEIAGLCDLSGVLAARLAQDYGLPPGAVARDAADLISRDLDAVVIANRHHGPLVRQALEAGLHVLVEKPVCWGLAEGAALADLERRSNAAVVGYMKRYDPAVRRLLDGAPEPLLARLHVFGGARHRYEKLHRRVKVAEVTGDDEDTAIDEQIATGLGPGHAERVPQVRTLAELAIHDLNLAHALFGPMRVESARWFATPLGPGFVVVLNANGTLITAEIVADFVTTREWDESLAVFHSEGSTELRFGSPFRRGAPTVTHERRAEGTDIVNRRTVVSYDSPYRFELEHLIDCAAGLACSETPIADAVADLQLVYDIARAAKKCER